MTKQADRQGFEKAIRQAPRDGALRRIYADWLREQGEEEAAQVQVRKAGQCTRFDPDFDYPACLKALGVRRRGPDAATLEPLADGEIVRLRGGEHDLLAKAGEVQQWLAERLTRRQEAGPTSVLRNGFWDEMPPDWEEEIEAPRGSSAGKALKAMFEASRRRQTYYRMNIVDTRLGSWDGMLVRRVGSGLWIEAGKRGPYTLMTQFCFEILLDAGGLTTKQDYEQALIDEAAEGRSCPFCGDVDGCCEHLLALVDEDVPEGVTGASKGLLTEIEKSAFVPLDAAIDAVIDAAIAVFLNSQDGVEDLLDSDDTAIVGFLGAWVHDPELLQSLTPARLRSLVGSVAKHADVHDYFVKRDRQADQKAMRQYIDEVCKDAGAKVRVTSRGEDRVYQFWCRDAKKVTRRVARLVNQDVKRLQHAVKSPVGLGRGGRPRRK